MVYPETHRLAAELDGLPYVTVDTNELGWAICESKEFEHGTANIKDLCVTQRQYCDVVRDFICSVTTAKAAEKRMEG